MLAIQCGQPMVPERSLVDAHYGVRQREEVAK